MADNSSKVPVKPEQSPRHVGVWDPISSLRRELDRLFDDFSAVSGQRPGSVFSPEPFWRGEFGFGQAPAVDIVEHDENYQVTAELPGMDEKDIDVKFADGVLTIKGEKREESEEKQKDYYRSERRFGAFQRSFRVPDGVEADKIAANVKDGVLTVLLPKSDDAKKREKKIQIKKS
ncbi:Hsp20/alpha crystallin family protein [Methyloceanibacter sp.]|uniref:Hsp20/alpha crystallin family protein n=1 Tax=Methyloceanibacter sp. TaxID=1965321 RepID=UPI003C70E326